MNQTLQPPTFEETIATVTIKNFKSFHVVKDFPLGRLNIISGCNGSGKSNFLNCFTFFGTLFSITESDLISNRYSDLINDNLPLHLQSNSSTIVSFKTTSATMVALEVLRENNIVKINSGIKPKNHKDCLTFLSSSFQVHEFNFNTKTLFNDEYYLIESQPELSVNGENIGAFLYDLFVNHNKSYLRIKNLLSATYPFFSDFIFETDERTVKVKVQTSGNLIVSFCFLTNGFLNFLCCISLLLQPTENLPKLILLDNIDVNIDTNALITLSKVLKYISNKTQLLVTTHSDIFINQFNDSEIINIILDKNRSVLTRRKGLN